MLNILQSSFLNLRFKDLKIWHWKKKKNQTRETLMSTNYCVIDGGLLTLSSTSKLCVNC